MTEAVDLYKQSQQLEAAVWEAVAEARSAGVPDTVLCDRVGLSRATLNRRLGSRAA